MLQIPIIISVYRHQSELGRALNTGSFPGNTTEAGGGKVVDQLFAGLVTYDAKGGIHNEVADSITSSDNATHYVIKLKSGWKFTDGTPVTAHSFVNAWNYTANSANDFSLQWPTCSPLLQHNRRL